MGCGACIFRELSRSQHRHIFNALERSAMQIRGELLITKHREALF